MIRRTVAKGDRASVGQRHCPTQAVDVAGHHQIKGATGNAQRTGGRDIIHKSHRAAGRRSGHRHAVGGNTTVKRRAARIGHGHAVDIGTDGTIHRHGARAVKGHVRFGTTRYATDRPSRDRRGTTGTQCQCLAIIDRHVCQGDGAA